MWRTIPFSFNEHGIYLNENGTLENTRGIATKHFGAIHEKLCSFLVNQQEKQIHITLYVIIHALCYEHILSLEYVP